MVVKLFIMENHEEKQGFEMKIAICSAIGVATNNIAIQIAIGTGIGNKLFTADAVRITSKEGQEDVLFLMQKENAIIKQYCLLVKTKNKRNLEAISTILFDVWFRKEHGNQKINKSKIGLDGKLDLKLQ